MEHFPGCSKSLIGLTVCSRFISYLFNHIIKKSSDILNGLEIGTTEKHSNRPLLFLPAVPNVRLHESICLRMWRKTSCAFQCVQAAVWSFTVG